MSELEINQAVTALEKMIANIEAQKSSLQKSIDIIRTECNHLSVMDSGPYSICSVCKKIIK